MLFKQKPIFSRFHSPFFLLWKLFDIMQRRLRRECYRSERKRVSSQQISRWFGSSLGVLSYLRTRSAVKFFSGLDDAEDVIGYLTSQNSEYHQFIVTRAENICAHRIEILAVGELDLDSEIDWLRDYSSNLRWEPAYVSEIDILDASRSSDIRVAWDLNRLYFFVELGIGYQATRDERYVHKFKELFSSWQAANPVGYTVNWVYAMEVGIRAVNMIWAFLLFLPSSDIDEQFVIEFLQTLIIHGRYIYRNLEYNDFASNHYIAGLTAMVFLGLYLPEYPEAKKWLKHGLKGLEAEIRWQVYDDGVDYEKSLPYHRLVTEMFMAVAIICDRNQILLSTEYKKRLERMLEFVQAYIAPDGSCPLIGDNDDGRLWRLGLQGVNDHRYLLSTGAVLYHRQDFKQTAQRLWEETAWIVGLQGIREFVLIPVIDDKCDHLQSSAFPDGGFYIMRSGNDHAVIDCGDGGRRGLGGHGHNDTLSFTLELCGESLLIDPGNNKYTANRNARFALISTRAHNTVMMDRVEMAKFRKRGIGGISDTPARLVEWFSNEKEDRFKGEHYGYRRLKSRVTHSRSIQYDKQLRCFSVTDILKGKKGRHFVEIFFHFAPSMDVRIKDGAFVCENIFTHNMYIVNFLGKHLPLCLEQAPVYVRYGIQQKGWVGSFSGEYALPIIVNYAIYRL